MSGRYHELNGRGNHGSHGPAMRNLPLFVFLTGLVFFFYVFYVYQAQSTELSLLKEQFEHENKQMRALKEELIDTKADLEKTRSSEQQLQIEKDGTVTKLNECQTSLRSVRLQSDTLGEEKSKLDMQTREKETRITDLQTRLTELENNNSANSQLIESKDILIKQLNQTVNILQQEVQTLKGGVAQPAGGEKQNAPAADAVNKPAETGNAVNNLGDLINKETKLAENEPKPAAEDLVGHKPVGESVVNEENGEKAEEKENKEAEGEPKEAEREGVQEQPPIQESPDKQGEDGAALEAPKGGEVQDEKKLEPVNGEETDNRPAQVQGAQYDDDADADAALPADTKNDA